LLKKHKNSANFRNSEQRAMNCFILDFVPVLRSRIIFKRLRLRAENYATPDLLLPNYRTV
jgi:hypothetical protein